MLPRDVTIDTIGQIHEEAIVALSLKVLDRYELTHSKPSIPGQYSTLHILSWSSLVAIGLPAWNFWFHLQYLESRSEQYGQADVVVCTVTVVGQPSA